MFAVVKRTQGVLVTSLAVLKPVVQPRMLFVWTLIEGGDFALGHGYRLSKRVPSQHIAAHESVKALDGVMFTLSSQ